MHIFIEGVRGWQWLIGIARGIGVGVGWRIEAMPRWIGKEGRTMLAETTGEKGGLLWDGGVAGNTIPTKDVRGWQRLMGIQW